MSIDFRIRDFFHPVSIWRMHRILDEAQWLPREEIESYQMKCLKETLEQAFSRVPYYRRLAERFALRASEFSSKSELARLPILKKPTVRRFHSDLVAEDAEKYHPISYTTSGSSGEPLRFLLDSSANALEFAYYWRHWSWGGYSLGDRFAELGSHYFLKRPAIAQESWHFQPVLGRLMLNSGYLSTGVARTMADAIRKYRPRFLKGIASALYFFAVSLDEPTRRDLEFRCAFSTGELLTDHYRETISRVLGCPVLDSYGHMERTIAVSECLSGGYHVNADYGLMEVEQVRKTELGETVGRVVGTSLYSKAMPLIRYDVGDEVALLDHEAPCPCGRTLPRIKRPLGRTADFIETPDGRFVTTLFILPELVPGIRLAQFVQTAASRLDVLVVPAEDWDAEAEGRLRGSVTNLVGPLVEVTIKVASAADLLMDSSGKLPVVVPLSGWERRRAKGEAP